MDEFPTIISSNRQAYFQEATVCSSQGITLEGSPTKRSGGFFQNEIEVFPSLLFRPIASPDALALTIDVLCLFCC